MLRHTEEEHAQGKLLGPWPVGLDADGNLERGIPFERFLVNLRFGRVQESRSATSYEVRPIDDCDVGVWPLYFSALSWSLMVITGVRS